MLLRDANAITALMSGVGLMVLVLATYHLRMVGRYRVQIALGGISLGTGCFTVLLTYLIEIEFIPLVLPRISLYILIFVSVVSILAGALNVSAQTRKTF